MFQRQVDFLHDEYSNENSYPPWKLLEPIAESFAKALAALPPPKQLLMFAGRHYTLPYKLETAADMAIPSFYATGKLSPETSYIDIIEGLGSKLGRDFMPGIYMDSGFPFRDHFAQGKLQWVVDNKGTKPLDLTPLKERKVNIFTVLKDVAAKDIMEHAAEIGPYLQGRCDDLNMKYANVFEGNNYAMWYAVDSVGGIASAINKSVWGIAGQDLNALTGPELLYYFTGGRGDGRAEKRYHTLTKELLDKLDTVGAFNNEDWWTLVQCQEKKCPGLLRDLKKHYGVHASLY